MDEINSKKNDSEAAIEVVSALNRANLNVNDDQLITLVRTHTWMQKRLGELRELLILNPTTQPSMMFPSISSFWQGDGEDVEQL
jgi:hypothetical protein